MKIDKESTTQRFGCCSGTDNISVENSVSDDVDIEECRPTVNIKEFVHQNDVDFPKRMSMDVQFQDIKYTVGKFSFRNRKYGKAIEVSMYTIYHSF